MAVSSSKKGFTLIELIIVISIVAILSLVGITSFSSIQRDARNTRRKGDLKELQKALEAYKTRNGEYPRTTPGFSGAWAPVGYNWLGTCGTWAGGISSGGKDDHDDGTDPEGYIPGLAPQYLPKLPRDPRESRANTANQSDCDQVKTCYQYMSNGADYKLLAHCTPEGTLSSEDPFYDPRRPAYSWQVSSSVNAINW